MPDANINAKIEKFTSVFNSYVSQVSSMDFDPSGERYRKILYFSLLEALAKTRYPKKRAGEAFSCFLVTYCHWVDGDKVSLPHLVAALERTAEIAFDQLRDAYYRKLRKWGAGGPLELVHDPPKAEVQQQWPKSDEGKCLTISELDLDWTAFQHRNLLYSYRSKLSHESREQTVSFEEPEDQHPFYESVLSKRDSQTEWHLVYPSGFLLVCCRTGIESLKSWLLSESKNPYLQFQFGHNLIDKLNDPNVAIHKPFR